MITNEVYLEVMEGEKKGVRYRLVGETITIGRSEECDIRLDEVRGVSRNHACIEMREGRILIRDLGSANGTYVNGKRMKVATLTNGTILRLGEISFCVIAPSLPASPPPSATPMAVTETLVESPQPLPKSPPTGVVSSMSAEQEEALLAEMGSKSARLALKTICLLALIAVGLYTMSALSHPRPSPPFFTILQKRERRVINFGVAFDRYEVLGKTGEEKSGQQGQPVLSAEPYRGLLVPSLEALRRNPNAPRRDLLVVQGLAEGDGEILLYQGEKLIRRRPILVRGVTPSEWPDDISSRAAADLAGEYVREAAILRADGNLYAALKKLESAEALYLGPADDPDKAIDLRIEMKVLRNDLSKRLCEIFDDAMARAFPVTGATLPVNYHYAYRRLDDAKQLVPDETSVDWQALSCWQDLLYALAPIAEP